MLPVQKSCHPPCHPSISSSEALHLSKGKKTPLRLRLSFPKRNNKKQKMLVSATPYGPLAEMTVFSNNNRKTKDFIPLRSSHFVLSLSLVCTLRAQSQHTRHRLPLSPSLL